MITVLSHFFIKDRDRMEDGSVRRAYGMLCSIVGILLNVLLFAGKYLAGVLSGSIAITADAFNNLSDAGSSFITLVGFRFSGMKADASHRNSGDDGIFVPPFFPSAMCEDMADSG